MKEFSVVDVEGTLFGIMDERDDKKTFNVIKENGCYDVIDKEHFNNCETLFVSENGTTIEVMIEIAKIWEKRHKS